MTQRGRIYFVFSPVGFSLFCHLLDLAKYDIILPFQMKDSPMTTTIERTKREISEPCKRFVTVAYWSRETMREAVVHVVGCRL